MFSRECCRFFKTAFSAEHLRWLLLCLLEMEEEEKRGTKEQGKIFQMKEENRNISFSFYQRVLVLVKTEIQIQLCKYKKIIELSSLTSLVSIITAHTFPLFFLQIFLLLIPACSFFVFSFLTN